MEVIQNGDMEMPNLQTEMERDPNFLAQTLRIKALVKEFKNLDKETVKERPMNRAVDGLSLSIFKDQIFVLLGHNGAGKTTSISMV
jgi:ABC-type multidrug transport system ATPase subunit